MSKGLAKPQVLPKAVVSLYVLCILERIIPNWDKSKKKKTKISTCWTASDFYWAWSTEISADKKFIADVQGREIQAQANII